MDLIWALPGKIFTIVVGLYFFSFLSKPYRIFFFQVILAMLVEILGFYLGAVKHQNNLWLFDLYNLVDLCLLGMAAKLLLPEGALRRNVVMLIVFGVVIWLVDFYVRGIKQILIWYTLYQYSLILVLYFTLLFGILFNNSRIINQPLFWVCLSVAIFYCVGLPYWAMFNYINAEHPEIALKLLHIKKVLNFMRYPMVGIAFYLVGKQNLIAKAI